MAASTSILQKLSASTATAKEAGTVRFKNANDFTVDTNNPLVIPAAGEGDWSYEVWLRLKITGTPPSDNISNIKAYLGAIPTNYTGLEIWARSASAFSAPAEPTTSTGMSNAFGFSVGNQMALSGTNFSGSGTECGSHLVLAMRVLTTATLGALSTAALTFVYDEI